MKRFLLTLVVILLYVSHQDIWNWRKVYPMAFGFIPIGLFYHACFVVASSLVLWMLVTYAWPAHLEEEIEGQSRKASAKEKAKEEGAR
jgi:hypothetical protein